MTKEFIKHPPQPGRNGYVVLHTPNPDEYVVLRTCMFCKEDSEVTVPAQGLYDWEHTKKIQDAFPNLTADQREQVMTGTHAKCWNVAMKEEQW
jgi:hypothetical protein